MKKSLGSERHTGFPIAATADLRVDECGVEGSRTRLAMAAARGSIMDRAGPGFKLLTVSHCYLDETNFVHLCTDLKVTLQTGSSMYALDKTFSLWA